MTTTHDDNAQTWRDLTDQLTTEQIAEAQRFERDALGDPTEVAALLLDQARGDAAANLHDRMMFGHLPTPAGATRVWHWAQDDDGGWSREFNGTARTLGHVDVTISGVQYADGSIRRTAAVYSEDRDDMGPAELRQLAGMLVAAADELDRLA